MNQTENDIVITDKVPRTHRILTFDLLRGFFLLVIMIDHIELYYNGWDIFTGKGRLWVSAAEGFFFMSGMLIGMMYKRRLSLGMKFIFKKMWTRAAELYVVGVALTLLFLAWAYFAHQSGLKDFPNPFNWHHYINQALLMRFTYGWADFLVRFAILMIIAPFVFYLIAKRLWWLAVIGIITAWAFRGQGFTLAWQLIFNLGIMIGFYWNELTARFNSLRVTTRRLIKRILASAAAVTFLASYSSVYLLSFLNWLWGGNGLPYWLEHVTWTWNRLNYDVWVYADKWTMGPLRVLLFFIWFPVLYWLFRRYEYRLNRLTFSLIELLGRNSLFVYTVHAFIVFVLKVYIIPAKTTFWQNFLITTSGMALLIAITLLYKRLKPRLVQYRLRLYKLSSPRT